MTATAQYKANPQTDLVLERIVDVSPERVWRAWTRPEQVMKWFTPAPWSTVDCEIDLRPGGIFRFVMRSPEGELFPHVNCFLEIVPHHKLVWTRALEPGYRPSKRTGDVPTFTAVILIEPHGSGTKYTAIAMHEDAAGAARHSEMGFHEGWGATFDQLVAMVKSEP